MKLEAEGVCLLFCGKGLEECLLWALARQRVGLLVRPILVVAQC